MQKAAMAELGYVFFFAPCCHPSFRLIAAVRKALAARGELTVFNILGPLLNPGRPAHVVLGAATPAMADKLADALQVLEIPAGLVVHGIIAPGRGIDELTTATVNLVRGAGRLRHVREEWTPQALGFTQSAFESVAGGDVETNLAIARALAGGGGPGGLADTIALNSAVALWVAGARPDVGGSIAEARELLLGGAVREKMERTLEFYSR
jgi:anthranilate phosphoribosyltransferase